MRRRTATRRRRWRWSRRARTCTARPKLGTVPRGCILGSVGFPTVSGRTVRPLGAKLQECLFWLCRRTALHLASEKGHTETAMALVKAGADVQGKTNEGYGSSRLHPRVVGLPQCGADGPSTRAGGAGVPVWAVQVDGAALGVGQRPHGDGDGDFFGGRGHSLPEQGSVRFSGCIGAQRRAPVLVGSAQREGYGSWRVEL
jgi:hypothetical protein